MARRILCVDEHPYILDLALEVLGDAGFEPLVRRTPFLDKAEIEALHPDLIVATITAATHCLGRQTLRLLSTEAGAGSIPVLVFFHGLEDLLPEEQNLVSQQISFVPSPLGNTVFLNCVHQALQRSSGQFTDTPEKQHEK